MSVLSKGCYSEPVLGSVSLPVSVWWPLPSSSRCQSKCVCIHFAFKGFSSWMARAGFHVYILPWLWVNIDSSGKITISRKVLLTFHLSLSISGLELFRRNHYILCIHICMRICPHTCVLTIYAYPHMSLCFGYSCLECCSNGLGFPSSTCFSNLAIPIISHKYGHMFGHSNSSSRNDTKEIIYNNDKIINMLMYFFKHTGYIYLQFTRPFHIHLI